MTQLSKTPMFIEAREVGSIPIPDNLPTYSSLSVTGGSQKLKHVLTYEEQEAKRLQTNNISLRRIKKLDRTLTGEVVPYNIIPLDALALTNAIGTFDEADGTFDALTYYMLHCNPGRITVSAAISVYDGNLMVSGNCILSDACDKILISPNTGDRSVNGALIGVKSVHCGSHLVFPDKGLRFMCLFRFKLWWMTQRMGSWGNDIPFETQFLIVEGRDSGGKSAVYAIFLPILEGAFRAILQGNINNELEICLESSDPDVEQFEGNHLVFVATRPDPFDVITNAVMAVENHLQIFYHREKKKIRFLEIFQVLIVSMGYIINAGYPDDKKPEDWDERAKIPDPEASKPDDWDEDAPMEIEDAEAEKLEGWLDGDPEASKPEDWVDEEDGAWEPPMDVIEKGEKQPNITIGVLVSVAVVILSIIYKILFGGKKPIAKVVTEESKSTSKPFDTTDQGTSGAKEEETDDAAAAPRRRNTRREGKTEEKQSCSL
ncbi:hypothetical protein GIB67_021399 [Kingdonia uniflora]|uniref:Uncharacterized protein n=1 Tax=Kingdonia uniflora TaxID=39325 RepID=A0A7J7MCW7_9MAGN|nr:hypothetical protein GIB67_021399 [Kingdonia uniflora]